MNLFQVTNIEWIMEKESSHGKIAETELNK